MTSADQITNPLWDSLFAPHMGKKDPFLHLPSGEPLSYDDYLALTSKIAFTLSEAGVVPGDRVIMQVSKTPEALALYGACVRCGAVFLPLNTAYTAAEVSYFANDAEPRVVVCDPSTEDAIRNIVKDLGSTVFTLNKDGYGTLIEEAQANGTDFAPVERKLSDLAAILYTSGTTGRSKGAMLTQENLLSNAQALVETWQFTSEDILFHALPIFHTHGLFVASNVTLSAGSSMIFMPSFKADEAISWLPKATSMMGVPTFYTRLLDTADFTNELVSHIRLFVSGSAPLLAETHKAFEARTGHRILERYGMTETGMITSNPYDAERRAGTVGFPLPRVSVRIANPETGALLGNDEIGVIEVKGPNVFSGYWRMPEKTAEEFRDDGYFITGDLGKIDQQDYVVIVGRSKDLIISGGYNVYPKEVELVIDEIDGVVESAVVGVQHPDFGEGVVGVVITETGADLEETTILEAMKDKLARYKQPKRIFFEDALPRNAMGKVQKNELRDRYADIFRKAS